MDNFKNKVGSWMTDQIISGDLNGLPHKAHFTEEARLLDTHAQLEFETKATATFEISGFDTLGQALKVKIVETWQVVPRGDRDGVWSDKNEMVRLQVGVEITFADDLVIKVSPEDAEALSDWREDLDEFTDSRELLSREISGSTYWNGRI